MLEVTDRGCSGKKLSWKLSKIHIETPVLESLSENITGLQYVRLATLLKKGSSTDVSESVVCRYSTN